VAPPKYRPINALPNHFTLAFNPFFENTDEIEIGSDRRQKTSLKRRRNDVLGSAITTPTEKNLWPPNPREGRDNKNET
jgi:hypothetical protein